MLDSYSRGEVIWLLSLTRDQAIEMDSNHRDSCAGLAASNESGGSISAVAQSVPTIARWADVQRARRDVIREKEGLAILQLRAGGFSEREIAKLSDRDRLALRRRWHATVLEILDRLGGPGQDEGTTSRIDSCLKCGEHPRVQLLPVKARTRGGWKIVSKGRQASVCRTCLSPELASRIVDELAHAA